LGVSATLSGLTAKKNGSGEEVVIAERSSKKKSPDLGEEMLDSGMVYGNKGSFNLRK